MDIDEMQAVSGTQAFEYFADLYREIIPMERALWLADNPLRKKIVRLMDKHLDAVDDAVIQLSHAPDRKAKAALIAALPPEHFYVLCTRWVNNTASLLQIGDQPAFFQAPGEVDMKPLIRFVLVVRTERIGSVHDMMRSH